MEPLARAGAGAPAAAPGSTRASLRDSGVRTFARTEAWRPAQPRGSAGTLLPLLLCTNVFTFLCATVLYNWTRSSLPATWHFKYLDSGHKHQDSLTVGLPTLAFETSPSPPTAGSELVLTSPSPPTTESELQLTSPPPPPPPPPHPLEPPALPPSCNASDERLQAVRDLAQELNISKVGVLVTGRYRTFSVCEGTVRRHVVAALQCAGVEPVLLANFLQTKTSEADIPAPDRKTKVPLNAVKPALSAVDNDRVAVTNSTGSARPDPSWSKRFQWGVSGNQIYLQHYSKAIAARHAQAYEARHGIKFDWLVQVRSDWCWIGDILDVLLVPGRGGMAPQGLQRLPVVEQALRQAGSRVLLLPSRLPFDGVDDRFAMGPRHGMMQMLTKGVEVMKRVAPKHLDTLHGERFFQALLAELDASVFQVNVPIVTCPPNAREAQAVLHGQLQRFTLCAGEFHQFQKGNFKFPECFYHKMRSPPACKTLGPNMSNKDAGFMCRCSSCGGTGFKRNPGTPLTR